MAGATELEPAASCVTGRHLSRSVNNLLIWPHEFSSVVVCTLNLLLYGGQMWIARHC